MSEFVKSVIRSATGDDSWDAPERKLMEELKLQSVDITFHPRFGEKKDDKGRTLYTLDISYYPATKSTSNENAGKRKKSNTQSRAKHWKTFEGRDKHTLAKLAVSEWKSHVTIEHSVE